MRWFVRLMEDFNDRERHEISESFLRWREDASGVIVFPAGVEIVPISMGNWPCRYCGVIVDEKVCPGCGARQTL